jgi:hypothetical protein
VDLELSMTLSFSFSLSPQSESSIGRFSHPEFSAGRKTQFKIELTEINKSSVIELNPAAFSDLLTSGIWRVVKKGSGTLKYFFKCLKKLRFTFLSTNELKQN